MTLPPRAFFTHVYESFVRVQGWLLAVIGILLSMLPLFWDQVPLIRISWVLAVGVVGVLLLATLTDAAYRAYHYALSPLPRVVAAIKAPDSVGLLLLEPSPLFAHQVAVSVYIRDGDFEVFVALGYVNTIQQDGRIQVIISECLGGQDELRTAIDRGNREYLNRCIVKPNLPWSLSWRRSNE